MRIWIDITNSPHVHFLYPIVRHLGKSHELLITARDFSETLPMLGAKGIDPIVIGDHKGKSRTKKVFGMMSRIWSIHKQVPAFDASISIGGQVSTLVSWLRKKPSIVFTDNDISYKYHTYKLGSYFIFPMSFNVEKVKRLIGAKSAILQYHGFKEQVYLADYEPDPDFKNIVPLDDYLLIRPENLKASYVPKNASTLVPKLLNRFKDERILYLPRYQEERVYCDKYDNVFMPDNALNGLDACFYSKAVLTGAGTFAREAAMLGVPAVSFFPRYQLLSVDRMLVEQGMMLHTRNIDDIACYITEHERTDGMVIDCKRVQQEVLGFLDEILTRI